MKEASKAAECWTCCALSRAFRYTEKNHDLQYGCAPRTHWRNDPADAERTGVEHYWYGYYGALSSANDVVTAIRKNILVITDAANTKMVETMGVLMQGMTMGELSLSYDSAFVVDENQRPSMPPR